MPYTNERPLREEPMTPRMFEDLLFPLWSRVHNEVADAESELTLHKYDPRVLQQIKRMLGADIEQLKGIDDIAVQKRALLRAREAVRALYRADETLQLDKWPALDYAFGWMVALDTFLHELSSCENSLNGCPSVCPKFEQIRAQAEVAATRALILHPKDEASFRQGFMDCVDARVGPNSESCSLNLVAV